MALQNCSGSLKATIAPKSKLIHKKQGELLEDATKKLKLRFQDHAVDFVWVNAAGNNAYFRSQWSVRIWHFWILTRTISQIPKMEADI
jgi:hypothetical protein